MGEVIRTLRLEMLPLMILQPSTTVDLGCRSSARLIDFHDLQ
jgi:hypothetical protein